MRTWNWRRRSAAVLVAALAGVLTGIPTGIIRSNMYHRMTPVLWWNYPIWAASAVLTGLIAATYLVHAQRVSDIGFGRAAGGSVLSVFAVGCPICNKLVVGLTGTAGALTFWAPIQPLLGLVSIGLLGFALRTRLRREQVCPRPKVPTAAASPVSAVSTPDPAETTARIGGGSSGH